MVSPYAPNESAATLLTERASMGGYFVKCVMYGFEVCLYIMTIQAMRRNRSFRQHLQHAAFITWIFIICSIHVGGALKAAVMDFVDNRAYPADPKTGNPGGPVGWSRVHYYVTPNALAGTCSYIIYASANAYLLFRFYIIYGSNKLYVLLPIGLYFTSIAFSVLLTLHVFATQDHLIQSVNTNLSLIFYSLDVSLNLLLTLLIVARILYTKRTVAASLPKEFSKTYTSVAAMLVESSALFSVVSIIFIACLKQSPPGATIMISMLTPIATISPTLIAYRVSNGESWSSDSYPFSSSMSFAPGETSGTRTYGQEESAYTLNKGDSTGKVNSSKDRDLEKDV